MNNHQNSCRKILVLHDNTPEDVAKAMIEDGLQKEPFYVLNMDEAYKRVEHFKKMMPRIGIFYAMKSNDSDVMIKLAAALGLGFDCASPGEIYKILSLGVSPQSIIFAVPNKKPEWMIYARTSGVQHTTFDSSYELKVFKQYWPDVRLLIRIRVDSDSIYKLGEKFGCDFETEAVDLLEEAAALDLNVVGVAFHVGSACSSINSHEEGLRQARALFDHETSAGRGMSIVDIGGGFLSDRTDRIDEISKRINTTLDKLFPEPSVQIIAEPGRYICDSTCNLYCNINNVRQYESKNSGLLLYRCLSKTFSLLQPSFLGKKYWILDQPRYSDILQIKRGTETVNMLYLNDGLYGTLRYNQAWHMVKRFERHTDIINEKLEKTILWGPSCDSNDRVMKNVEIMLPRCTPVDWLIFNSQGAYTFGFASSFSCLPRPQIRAVISPQLWQQIKEGKVFEPEDFEKHSNISAPLPPSLPTLIKKTEFIETNILKI